LQAKGVSDGRILLHVLKNAAPTCLAVMGLQAGNLIGGSILIETVFAWPVSGHSQPDLELGTHGDELHEGSEHVREEAVLFVTAVPPDALAEEARGDAYPEHDPRLPAQWKRRP